MAGTGIDRVMRIVAMRKFVAYIDESGVKQKAATRVEDGDAFGLAVGILVPKELEEKFIDKLEKSIPKLPDNDTHITDLSGSQEAYRKAVFGVINALSDVKVVYEAIFASGYHHAEYELMLPAYNEYLERQKTSKIKHSVRLENPSSHAELLAGVVLKARALAVDLCESDDVEVVCKTDEVDDSILEESERTIKDFSTADWVSTEKGFNIETGELVQGTIETSIMSNQIINLGKWNIQKLSKGNVGVFAADIVANSLHFHIGEYISRCGHKSLNDRSAFVGFALEKSIVTGDRDFSDLCYNGCLRGGRSVPTKV